MDISKFNKIPIDEATKIPEDGGVYELVKNYYWWVTDDNCVLQHKKYGGYQANYDIRVMKSLAKDRTGGRIEKIENIFLPWDTAEYSSPG